MDDKGGSRNRNVAISHHGFSAFVSANGRPEQFPPHRKAQLSATALLEWEQGQTSPLDDEPGPGVQLGQVQGECLSAAGRSVAALPGVWFPGRAPFSLRPLLAEYAGGVPSSSCLPLSPSLCPSFRCLALPPCSNAPPASRCNT